MTIPGPACGAALGSCTASVRRLASRRLRPEAVLAPEKGLYLHRQMLGGGKALGREEVVYERTIVSLLPVLRDREALPVFLEKDRNLHTGAVPQDADVATPVVVHHLAARGRVEFHRSPLRHRQGGQQNDPDVRHAHLLEHRYITLLPYSKSYLRDGDPHIPNALALAR